MTVNNKASLISTGVDLCTSPQNFLMLASCSTLLIGRVITVLNLNYTSAAVSFTKVGKIFVDYFSWWDGIAVIQSLYAIIHDKQTVWANRTKLAKDIQCRNKDFSPQLSPRQWMMERVIVSCAKIFSCSISFAKFLSARQVVPILSSKLRLFGSGTSIALQMYGIYAANRKRQDGPPPPPLSPSSVVSMRQRELHEIHYTYEMGQKISILFIHIIGMVKLLNSIGKGMSLSAISKHYMDLFLLGCTCLSALTVSQWFHATAEMTRRYNFSE